MFTDTAAIKSSLTRIRSSDSTCCRSHAGFLWSWTTGWSCLSLWDMNNGNISDGCCAQNLWLLCFLSVKCSKCFYSAFIVMKLKLVCVCVCSLTVAVILQFVINFFCRAKNTKQRHTLSQHDLYKINLKTNGEDDRLSLFCSACSLVFIWVCISTCCSVVYLSY